VPQAVANPNAMLGSLRTHDLKLSCSAATSTSAQAPMPEMQSLLLHVRAQLPRLHGTAPATSLHTDLTAPAPQRCRSPKDQRVSLCRVGRSKVKQMESSQASFANMAAAPFPGPNPSFELTHHGMAPGPRGAFVYHAPHGPGATPQRAAQFQR
jgi:hypothetical protein